jgi:hypothetical protein
LLKFVENPEERDVPGCLVKFADLGSAETGMQDTKTSVGTLEYRPLEIILRSILAFGHFILKILIFFSKSYFYLFCNLNYCDF